MLKIKLICFAQLIIICCCSSCDKDNFSDPNDDRFVVNEGTDPIKLNIETTFQTIDHFGASSGFQDQWIGVWPDASREPLAEALFSTEMDENGNPKGIGLTMWRSIIGSGARDQPNIGSLNPEAWFRANQCYLDPDGNYDWTKQAGTQWFLEKAKDYGVPNFTLWITTPPYFMTENGYVFLTENSQGFNCPPANYQAYADFLAEVTKHYEDKGYNIGTVCPFNETQYVWGKNLPFGQVNQSGTFCSNAELATVTRIIDQTFTNKGVNAKIMVPETAQIRYLYELDGSSGTTNQLPDFFDDGSANYIGNLTNLSNHIAAHSYFSNSSPAETIRQRETLRDELPKYGNLDYWQTEYSIIGTDYQQDTGRIDFPEIYYSLWLAHIIHADLYHGNATGWSFWTAFNQGKVQDQEFRFALIPYSTNANNESQTDGTARLGKNLWALGNYSRFVRPGMVRFDVENTSFEDPESALENLMVTGFKDTSTNEIVLVFVNRTPIGRQISLTGYGDDYTVVDDQFDSYTTSETQDLEHAIQAANEIILPAESIVTLKAKLQ